MLRKISINDEQDHFCVLIFGHTQRFSPCTAPGQQFFSHVGTESPLPGHLPVLWGTLKCLAQRHYTAVVGFEPCASSSGVLILNCAQTQCRISLIRDLPARF